MESREKGTSFPVWIGSLAESVNEQVLMMHFNKFGPIRGYVNYSNLEVAERAADQMNNVEICGKKIKTKGPHDQPIKSSISSERKLEIINLTDCYYFTQFGKCEVNTGKTCQYRHFDLLQKTKEVCPNWGNKSCTNLKCPKLHPSQRQYKENSNNSEMVLERCKSHNAFKCYGQCGKTDCDIHFNDERKLYDHITEGKSSLLPCKICNAVFFNKDEMERHSHPEYSTKYGSTAKLNSINTPAPHSGINVVPIGVFWDIENCQVPKNKSALAIVKKLRDRFYPGRKEAEFICVCDTKKEKEDVLEDLNKAQVNVIHINASSKNAADDKLKQQLRRFAQSYPSPATVLLVSGDINFVADLSDLRYRHNLHIILLHNKQASQALLQCAHESECFDIFTDSILPHSPMLMTSETKESNQLAVFNIPHCKNISTERITQRLNLLSQNTGGKVIKVKAFKSPSNNKAIISFPNVDCARRALQRINGENIFGYTINVSFHFEKNKKIKNNEKKIQAEQPREHEDIENKTRNNSASGVYTNLKKFSSASTPILNSVHGNSRRKKGINKQNANQNKVLNEEIAFKSNQNVVKFMPPLIENSKQNDVNHTPFIIPPLMEVFPFGMPSLCNVNPVLPNGLIKPPFNKTEIFNGITIQVSNLDKSKDFKEIKSGLDFLFRKYSKVLHISQGQTFSKTLNALVTVANMQDAQLCISKLDNCLLFNRPIKLSQLNKDNIGLVKMKENVEAILCETFSGWLPLQDFLLKYKVKHEQPFHVLNFEHMKDLIYIDGKPGYQFICLLSFRVGLTLKLDIEFQGKLEGVLLSHNRKVPLASLPGLYWSYQQNLLPLGKGGIPLNHVLSKNITLVGLPGSQAVFHKKLPSVNGYSLSSFQSEIILLLKMSPKFEIPWNRFCLHYNLFFGRELCFQDFKCNDLEELISKVSEIVKVDIQNNNRVVTFTRNFTVQILNEELDSLIMSCNRHKLPVTSLFTTYYRFFGHKFVLANYGFNSLQSLLSSLQHPFKVFRVSDKQILTKVQAGVKKSSQSIKEFAEEIISIIKELPEKRVAINILSSEYRKKYGRQLKLNKLGFSTFNDLVGALSGLVKVEVVDETKYLSLLENIEHPALWHEITLVIKKMPYLTIMALHLPNYYTEMFRKPFPLVNLKTTTFFDIIPPTFLSIGAGSNRILMSKESCPCILRSILLENFLYSCEEFTSNSLEISNIFKKFGNILKPEEVKDIFGLCRHPSFKVVNNGITLAQSAACKMFEHDIISLLHEEPELNLKLKDIIGKYQKKFGKTLKVTDFGYTTLHALCANLTGGIVVVKRVNENDNENLVELGPLGKIYFKCKSVVDFHHGTLMLCNFATEYHKMHGTQIKLADYGFNKILDLINCFHKIFLVHTEKNMKLIISIEHLNNSSGFNQDFDIRHDLQLDQLKFDVNSEESDEDNADLLEFDDDGKDDVLSDLMEKELANPLEWWMEPNPNLSDSVLEPELSQNVVYDLISFTEFEDNQNIDNGGSDDFGKVNSVKPLHSHQVNDLAEVFSYETPIEKVANNFVESESCQSFNRYSCFPSSTSVAEGLQKTPNSNGINTSDKISVRPKLAANFSKN
ncbi:meiosis regulator and mRNA stability factor 1 isoform X2 [Hydra vulgaris]|uniref:meiosis regulator and mRNA stability factor 1 isoform X2 n=1 Tax=Hydra vulgaris TaxID=6087 RepID=UPI001F5F2737|nr:meiosis regulator and mRNA stability factor 1 isoform X3 [Hydra vulgaris]